MSQWMKYEFTSWVQPKCGKLDSLCLAEGVVRPTQYTATKPVYFNVPRYASRCGFLWYKIIPLLCLMGGIKIFRLQEWKVRATACTRSLNLAAAGCLSWHDWQHPVQPDNTSNLNTWRQDQHLLKTVRKPTNTEDSTSTKLHNYWFQCKRFDFLATMLRKTWVFWDMALCCCELVPGVSNNRKSFIFSLSSGSSSFDCITTLRYLKSYVSSDTFYIPEHFHNYNFFFTFPSALNVMKHNE